MIITEIQIQIQRSFCRRLTNISNSYIRPIYRTHKWDIYLAHISGSYNCGLVAIWHQYRARGTQTFYYAYCMPSGFAIRKSSNLIWPNITRGRGGGGGGKGVSKSHLERLGNLTLESRDPTNAPKMCNVHACQVLKPEKLVQV